MRPDQSSDQFAARAWTGGQGTAPPPLPRHQSRATVHEHRHPPAPAVLPERTDAAHLSPAPAICALTTPAALTVRANPLPRSTKICAANDNLKTVSFYDVAFS